MRGLLFVHWERAHTHTHTHTHVVLGLHCAPYLYINTCTALLYSKRRALSGYTKYYEHRFTRNLLSYFVPYITMYIGLRKHVNKY